MDNTTNTLDLRRFIRSVRQLRWVYVALILFFCGAAIYYIYRSLPKVQITGEMLIGEESMTDGGAGILSSGKGAGMSAGGMGQIMKTFSVGGFGGAAVDNELIVLTSQDVKIRTIKALNLNRVYIGEAASGKKAQLWKETPIYVEAPKEYFDTLSTPFALKIELLPGGKANIKAVKGLLKRTLAEANDVSLPTVFNTPYGSLQILRGQTFDSSPYRKLYVSISGNNTAAEALDKMLDIDVETKLSDVIKIDLNYPNAELGKAIVDGLMAEYNAKRLDRIHENAVNSIKYYDDRIAETLKTLEDAEKKAADYQRSTSLTASEAEAKLLASLKTEGQAKVIAAQHTIDYYTTVLGSIKNSLDSDDLIPQLKIAGDSTVNQYNRLIMERRQLRQSATEDNSSLIQLNEQITNIADLIKTNASLMIRKAKSELEAEANIAGMAHGRLDNYPESYRVFAGLERNQVFQNSLYVFLVQARENAVLKLYTDTDLGYVFQPAYTTKPGLPVKQILLIVIALFFAIGIATIAALIHMRFSQRIKSPMDVAFIGTDRRAIVTDGSPEQAARMRTLLMANPKTRIIFTANFCETNVAVASLVSSFEAANLPVAEIEPASNSIILSPETTEIIRESSESNRFTLVRLPQPTDVFMVENEIDQEQAVLLISIPTTMKRFELKKLLKGQTSAKVYTFIVS